MKQELDKCVLVIDEAMPRGLAANTAAILGITWGRLRPELVGEDVTDAAGAIHPGIIRTPVPVLSGRPLYEWHYQSSKADQSGLPLPMRCFVW